MTKKDAEAISCLLALLYLPFMVLIGAAVGGFTVKTLWAWFIVPIFGLHPLTIVQALGVALVLSVLTKNFDLKDRKDDEADPFKDAIKGTVKVLFLNGFFLAYGWGVKQFM